MAERTMYFDYQGQWPGGTMALGAEAGHRLYVFAEGSTRWNPQDGYFDEWLSLQNTGASQLNVKVTFLRSDGGTTVKTFVLGSKTRTTFSVNAVLGSNVDASIQVEASGPIVAERTMYFDYHGFASGGGDSGGYRLD